MLGSILGRTPSGDAPEDFGGVVAQIEARIRGDRGPLETDREDELGRLHEAIEGALAERRDLRRRVDSLERQLAGHETDTKRARDAVEGYREVMAACADGDLTRRVETEDDPLEVGADCNAMLSDLEDTVREMKELLPVVVDAADQVTDGTEAAREANDEIAEAMQDISAGAGTQTDRLQALNAEMETLSSSIEEIATTVETVADFAAETAETGQEGREAARDAIEGMDAVEAGADDAVDAIEDLQEEMGEIGEITRFISRMAGRTNMLALNANIEASRTAAGGQSEFGVVANEVKDLAEETKEAAEDIEGRLERIREKTQLATSTVQETSERITENAEAVENAAGALDEIADYAERTNEGVQNINEAASEQAASASQVVSLAEDTAAISEQTAELSERVADETTEQTTALHRVADHARDLAGTATTLEDVLDGFDVTGTPGSQGLTGEASPTDGDVASVGTGLATDEDPATAAQAATKRAVTQLGRGDAALALVFTPAGESSEAAVAGVREVLGPEAAIVGTPADRQGTTSSVDPDGVAVWLLAGDGVGSVVGHATGLAADVGDTVATALAELPLGAVEHPTVLAVYDDDGGNGEAIAEAIDDDVEGDVTVVGAGAAGSWSGTGDAPFTDSVPLEDGLVLALLDTAHHPVARVEHGFESITDPMTATATDGTTVEELDGEPAAAVWRRAVERHCRREIDWERAAEDDRALEGLLSTYPLATAGGTGLGNQDSLKPRWPGATTVPDGGLEFPTPVAEGTELRVVFGSRDDQQAAASDAVVAAADDLGENGVAGGLVLDCSARDGMPNGSFQDTVDGIADVTAGPLAAARLPGVLLHGPEVSSGCHHSSTLALLVPE